MIRDNTKHSGIRLIRTKQLQLACHICICWSFPRRKVRVTTFFFHAVLIGISATPAVWNVVGLTDTRVIEEMMQHFSKFWGKPEAVDKVNKRIELAVQEREQEVINQLEKDAPEKVNAFREVMESVQDYRRKCAERLPAHKDAIVFRFHAWPDASIPHLHMHVLTSSEEFRKYSTPIHDFKAIPAEIVLEVIKSENSAAFR